MTNREKLFKLLEEKENKDLAEMVDFSCTECPAHEFCANEKIDTCQETLYTWLEDKEQEDE